MDSTSSSHTHDASFSPSSNPLLGLLSTPSSLLNGCSISNSSTESFRCVEASRIEFSVAVPRTQIFLRRRKTKGLSQQKKSLGAEEDDNSHPFAPADQRQRTLSSHLVQSPDHWDRALPSSAPADSRLTFERGSSPTRANTKLPSHPPKPLFFLRKRRPRPRFTLPQDSYTTSSSSKPTSRAPPPLVPYFNGFYTEEQKNMLEESAKAVARRRSDMSHRRGKSEPVGWERDNSMADCGKLVAQKRHLVIWEKEEGQEERNHEIVTSPLNKTAEVPPATEFPCSPQYRVEKMHHARSFSAPTASYKGSSLHEVLAQERNWTEDLLQLYLDDIELDENARARAPDFKSLPTLTETSPLPVPSTSGSKSSSYDFGLVPKERKSAMMTIRDIDGELFELVK
ncbi:hypothetical protein BT69DRAFT_1387734 [Atractiella rhizophila]|nr:hypothetical protein BT69DRAFT_1387734 [Atractiella rhizophila]